MDISLRRSALRSAWERREQVMLLSRTKPRTALTDTSLRPVVTPFRATQQHQEAFERKKVEPSWRSPKLEARGTCITRASARTHHPHRRSTYPERQSAKQRIFFLCLGRKQFPKLRQQSKPPHDPYRVCRQHVDPRLGTFRQQHCDEGKVAADASCGQPHPSVDDILRSCRHPGAVRTTGRFITVTVVETHHAGIH